MVDNHNLMDLMEEYITECQIRKLSPVTIKGYRKLLTAFLMWVGDNENVDTVDRLTPQHYKQYILYKQEHGAGPQYINDILRVMRTFSAYIFQEGYTGRLLTENIKNVKQPRVKIIAFNEQEIKDMINYFSHPNFQDTRNKAILSVLFDTGIRCEELTSLLPEQIHKNHILINGKGSKQRLVPLSPVLAKAIQRYVRARTRYFKNKITAPNLFLTKYGTPLTNNSIAFFMKEAAEEVGVRKSVRISPHTCRHTFAHTQLRNGCDLFTLSRLLGHESVSITQRYLEGVQDDEVVTKGLKYSPLMNME